LSGHSDEPPATTGTSEPPATTTTGPIDETTTSTTDAYAKQVVDSATMCDMQKCPDVSNMLPIDMPLGFVGETLDGEGGFMPCAPAADNFLTYYKNATAPALAVTVLGANHMSFIDDVASCGITCSFCKMATLDNKVVNDLARAYVVAFYSRWLKDIAGYDTYLTGAEAKARYVDTKLVTIASK
jgi:hypothetical protein